MLPNGLIPTGWMKFDAYCTASGETRNTFKNKRKKGMLKEGFHVKRAADGGMWIHWDRMQEWVEDSVYIPVNEREETE